MSDPFFQAPREKTRFIIIFGIGDLAAIAYEYFTRDNGDEVVGFVVDDEYMPSCGVFCGKYVVPFSKVADMFPPVGYHFHAALVYNNMNRDRANAIAKMKALGYLPASYISSRAFVWPNAIIGEHVFIMEDNTVQPFTTIGNNVILWSGNHTGHHSTIGDNVFVSSHVVISGHCDIGANCFLGVNATLANATSLGEFSWVGHSTVLSGEIPSHSLITESRSPVSVLDEEALARALKRTRHRSTNDGRP